MAKFAYPIVIAQAGFMFMGVVETAMLGRLGAVELAGTAVARSFFWTITIFLMGIISAVDILASHAFGAKRGNDLRTVLVEGIKFALMLSSIGMVLILVARQSLALFNYEDAIIEHASTYLGCIVFGLPFMLVFTLLQRYLQSQERTRAIVFVVILADLLNYGLNHLLIFGAFGFPGLGVLGASWAANISRAFMCIALIVLVIKEGRIKTDRVSIKQFFSIDRRFVKNMMRFGIPAGMHQVFEVGAFSVMTLLSAKLLPSEAAAHQIVLIVCSFTYMIPVGFANAAAFRVGQLVGQDNVDRARIAGHSAIVLCSVIMLFSAALLYLYPEAILSLFTKDQNVVAIAQSVIIFGAAFQIFDAIQGSAIGALRGAGNTAYASIVSAIGFYGFAVPVGFVTCFVFDLRLTGLWIGLLVGLSFIAAASLWLWLSVKPVRVLGGVVEEA